MLILRLQLLVIQRQLYVPTRRNGNKRSGFHFTFIIYIYLLSKLQVTTVTTQLSVHLVGLSFDARLAALFAAVIHKPALSTANSPQSMI